jgi:hypothetical protein
MKASAISGLGSNGRDINKLPYLIASAPEAAYGDESKIMHLVVMGHGAWGSFVTCCR